MSDTLEIENKYNTESLDFINSYKTYFSPLLASIAATLNDKSEESKALLVAMKTMTNTPNSNLKELIVKLKELKGKGGNDAEPISHNGNYSKYVAQCLRLIQLQHSKQQRHDLFSSVMRDMKENPELMDQLKTLKASTDWKKMVGMLIPEGANVKILTTVNERSKSRSIWWNKPEEDTLTAVSSKEITGTVVKRAKLTGKPFTSKAIGEFKKLVKLEEGLIRNKGDNNVEFSPEHIQLIEPEIEPDPSIPVAVGTPETETPGATGASGASGASGTETGASGSAAKPVATGSAATEGGSQRITRKHKNSIIGSARKTRTNR